MKKDTIDNDPIIGKSINTALRLGFIALLLVMSFLILKAFIAPILWGIIIAVAVFPLHKRFTKLLGGRSKLSVVLLVLISISILIVPLIMITSSTVDSVKSISKHMDEGTLVIPPANPDVAEWPVIGKPIFDLWNIAHNNISDLLTKFAPQIQEYAPKVLGAATDIVGTIILFIISMIIAGAFLMNTESSEKTAKAVFKTLAGKAGEDFASLASATIRSVVQGVLGTAIIQTIFISIGLFAIGFPGAGLISLFILFLAITQLPVALIMIPAIIYVFSYADTTPAIIFAVWSVIWSLSDSYFKSILMGRGMDIPMLVILLGAIGGMLLGGIIGLFIGSVLLAFAYKVFQAIINIEEVEE